MSVAAAISRAVRDANVAQIPALSLYKAAPVESKQEFFGFHRKSISVQKFADSAEVDIATARIMLNISYRVYQHHVKPIPNLSGNSEARFLAYFILCYRWVFSLPMFWGNDEPWKDASKFKMKDAEAKAASTVGNPEVLLFRSDVPSDEAKQLRLVARPVVEMLSHRSTRIETIRPNSSKSIVSAKQLARNPTQRVLEPPGAVADDDELKDVDTLSDNGPSSSRSNASDLYEEPPRRETRSMAREQAPVARFKASGNGSSVRVVTRSMAKKQDVPAAAPVPAKGPDTARRRQPEENKGAPVSSRSSRRNGGELLPMVDNPDKIGKSRRQPNKPRQEERKDLQPEESDTDSEASTQEFDYEYKQPAAQSNGMQRAHARRMPVGISNSLYLRLIQVQWITQFYKSPFLQSIRDAIQPTEYEVDELPAGLFVIAKVDASRGPPYVVAITGQCAETSALEAWADTFQTQFKWEKRNASPVEIEPLSDKTPYFVYQVYHPEELETVVNWYSQLHDTGMYHGPCELMLIDGVIIISPPLGAGKARGIYYACSRYSILPNPSAQADLDMLLSLPCFNTAYGEYLRNLSPAERTLNSLTTLPCDHCKREIKTDARSYGYGVCDNGHIVHAQPEFADDEEQFSLVLNCNSERAPIGNLKCLECESSVKIVLK